MKNWMQDRLDVNGVSLRYFRSGGSLPPLVLVHGFTDNALYYTRTAEVLAHHWDVIAYDCRGHGESGRANGSFTDADRANDLLSVVDKLGLDRPAMMGHSMGGSTIANALEIRPNVSRGVVLEDPAWWEIPANLPASELETLHRTRDERNRAWHDSMVAVQAMTRDEGLAWRRSESPDWSDTDVALSYESRLQVELDLFTYFPSFEAPWRSAVAAFGAPSLLVIGEKERGGIITVETATEAATLNPKLQWKQILGAGHSIRYDQFDAFINVVGSFLEPLAAG
jgi:N-formylmaleamate deformylase